MSTLECILGALLFLGIGFVLGIWAEYSNRPYIMAKLGYGEFYLNENYHRCFRWLPNKRKGEDKENERPNL